MINHNNSSVEDPIHVMILKAELSRRTRMNSKYSLRSFAQHLNIDPSLLSKVIKNARPMSMAMATNVMERTQLSESEKKLFWKSFISLKQSSKNQTYLTQSTNETDERLIDEELFKVISCPHHYALVELTRVKSFKSDYKWISNILGITEGEARASVLRLVKVGMLSNVDNKIVRLPGRFTTKNKSVTDSAHKYHQRKVLEQAIEALDEVPLERRNQSSMTIAVNPQKIPLAKKMIENFINELSDVLETGSLEEVYQMSFGLFPVSKK